MRPCVRRVKIKISPRNHPHFSHPTHCVDWLTQKHTTPTQLELNLYENKAGYTATPVACRWAGAIFEVTRPFGQEQWGQRNKIIKKSKV